MTTKEKLTYLLDATGLSQEKLAQRLDVSFATLNSWINERSVPHKKKQEKIDEMYRLLTGDRQIPAQILQRRKDEIYKLRQKVPNIITKIIERDDIYKEFILSLTYNTNRIEGSTLSEPETAAILFNNAIIPNKDLVEHLEAKNHQTALEFLFSYIKKDLLINEEIILKLHSILMNGIRSDAGNYRNHSVRIVGANIPTANNLKVPELIKELINEVQAEAEDVIKQAAIVHSRFEQIHPFSDGNGRIGRLLVHAQMLKADLPPVIINQFYKRLYYAYLNKCQRIGDSTLLEEFFCDGLLAAYRIIGK